MVKNIEPLQPATKPRVNTQQLAVELLRALRGKRSRPGFSRFLGYRSNIAQRWERELCWPSASTFFRICRKAGAQPEPAVQQFLRRTPEWLQSAALEEPNGVARLLNELRGTTAIVSIAERSGLNRYSISRWFKGSTVPRLPELLRLIDALSSRLPDFAAALVDPVRLPSVQETWQQLEAARTIARTHPMSHAVLRALDLEAYQQHPRHNTSLLARHVSLSEEETTEALELLLKTKQARRVRGRYQASTQPVIDTGGDLKGARALKVKWTEIALERMRSGAPGYFGYSLFTVSRATLQQLKEIHHAYVREMSSAIAASQESQCVGLYCSQLLDLAIPEESALAPATNATGQ